MKWNSFGSSAAKKGTKITLVRARFNESVTVGLVEGARKALTERGVNPKHISIIEVPGTFDIPYGVVAAFKKYKPHAVVALGAVIKGETKHDEYIAHATFATLHDLMQKYGRPIPCGIITTNTREQAEARSDSSERNVGYQAACAALELLRV